METVIEMQQALKQYQEALLLHSQVLQLESLGSRALQVFKEWFIRKQQFANRGNELFKNNDIVALRPSHAQDPLSKHCRREQGGYSKKKERFRCHGEKWFTSPKNTSRQLSKSSAFSSQH